MENAVSDEAPTRIRAFVAVELPEELKRRIAEVQARLQRTPLPVRWVRMEGVHLTLEFLGYIEEERLGPIEDALTAAATPIRPFELQVRGAGVFPSWRRPRVVWLGVEGALGALQVLQRRVETELSALGFAPEQREFSPHLTLGRVTDTATAAQREEVGLQVKMLGNVDCGSLPVTHLSLMQSQLSRSGAIYRSLREAELNGR